MASQGYSNFGRGTALGIANALQAPNRLPSPLDTLRASRERLSADLDAVNAAINALEDNPEVAHVLDLVGAALGR